MKHKLYLTTNSILSAEKEVKFTVNLNDPENIKVFKDLLDYPGANPRTQDKKSQVCKDIRNSMKNNPLFGATTEGVAAVVDDFTEVKVEVTPPRNEPRYYIEFDFDLQDRDSGQFNGGHNISEGIDYMKLVECWQTNNLPDHDKEFVPNWLGAYMPFHFLHRSLFKDRKGIRDLANGRNTRVGIRKISELNLSGAFDDLKAVLGPEFENNIKWSENQKGPTGNPLSPSSSITEVTQILSMFFHHFDHIGYNIEDSRKTVGKAPEICFSQGNQEHLAISQCYDVAKDILKLRDEMIALANQYALENPTTLILRGLSQKAGMTAAAKMRKAASSSTNAKNYSTTRRCSYFGKEGHATYSTTTSQHRLFLWWFVRNCFTFDKNQNKVVYSEYLSRKKWSYERMLKVMTSSLPKMLHEADLLYRNSFIVNSCREEDWLIQKNTDPNLKVMPFDECLNIAANQYTVFRSKELAEKKSTIARRRVANG